MKVHGWPKTLQIAAGMINVKSPFVQSPEGVRVKLHIIADIYEITPERVLGGMDCGFGAFAGLRSVRKSISLQKLKPLAEDSRL